MLRAATFFVVPQVGSPASLDGSALLWVALRTPEESPSRYVLFGVVWCHRQHVSRLALRRSFAAQVQHHLRSGLLVPDPASDGRPLQREA